jgi:hypothetical protein
MTTPESVRLAAFRGGVSCRRDPNSPLGLTLVGRTTDQPDEMLSLAFSAAAPADLPEALEDPTVERFGAQQYRVSRPPREWIIHAPAVHLHREIATAFYRVIPPRVPSLSKRLFWKALLALLATSAGERLLLALRRR